MHGTLKAETAKPPAATTAAQQGASIAFAMRFNHQRPHEALGQTPDGAALPAVGAQLSGAA